MNWSRICCPVDFSEASYAALVEAAALAVRERARLLLLHVVDHEELHIDDGIVLTPPELEAIARRQYAEKLDAWRADAERLAPGLVDSEVVAGRPAHEVVQLVRSRGIDLVVVGAHAVAPVRHLLLGAVADRIEREAPCSVFVVRSPSAMGRAAA
jgi:universal stress protein A